MSAVQISVQLTEAAARSGEVATAAVGPGVSLVPTHPGTDDPVLARFYLVEVADEAEADHVLARLRAAPEVEAAYLKPPDALP